MKMHWYQRGNGSYWYRGWDITISPLVLKITAIFATFFFSRSLIWVSSLNLIANYKGKFCYLLSRFCSFLRLIKWNFPEFNIMYLSSCMFFYKHVVLTTYLKLSLMNATEAPRKMFVFWPLKQCRKFKKLTIFFLLSLWNMIQFTSRFIRLNDILTSTVGGGMIATNIHKTFRRTRGAGLDFIQKCL